MVESPKVFSKSEVKSKLIEGITSSNAVKVEPSVVDLNSKSKL